jgi:hypothetical protein
VGLSGVLKMELFAGAAPAPDIPGIVLALVLVLELELLLLVALLVGRGGVVGCWC